MPIGVVAERTGLAVSAIRYYEDQGLITATRAASSGHRRFPRSVIAASFDRDLSERIAELQLLRDKLAGCIGCGCLSLLRCAIWNPNDVAATFGPGARWLQGDESPAG